MNNKVDVKVNEITVIDMEQERRNLRSGRVILITSEIDSGAAHEFVEDMEVLLQDNSKEPITLIFASPGGDAFSGMTMLRAIRKAQVKGIRIIGEVYGHACSMAFFLLQSCDERVMGKMDVLMAHGLTTGFEGDIRNMEAESKLLTFWHHELSNLVARRCSGEEFNEPGFWYEILRDNTPQWYTSEESREMGLIDKIEDDNY